MSPLLHDIIRSRCRWLEPLATGMTPSLRRLPGLRAVVFDVYGTVLLSSAMTLRYGIFIQADHWGDRRLLVHELAHVAQYERFGAFRRFLFQYLQECINPGYPLGDLELEAKKAEDSCC